MTTSSTKNIFLCCWSWISKLLIFVLPVLFVLLLKSSASLAFSATVDNLKDLPATKNLRIACAANFVPVLANLEKIFREKRSYGFEIVSGASGLLYAQITQGAQFDAFLSADAKLAKQLAEGMPQRVFGEPFIYSHGRIVLVGPPGISNPLAELKKRWSAGKKAGSLAVADSKLAPYGLAAEQALPKELAEQLPVNFGPRPPSVGQAWSLYESGSVPFAVVPMAMVKLKPQGQFRGSVFEFPSTSHDPILQTGVLLSPRKEVAEFREFLLSKEVQSDLQLLGLGN